MSNPSLHAALPEHTVFPPLIDTTPRAATPNSPFNSPNNDHVGKSDDKDEDSSSVSHRSSTRMAISLSMMALVVLTLSVAGFLARHMVRVLLSSAGIVLWLVAEYQ